MSDYDELRLSALTCLVRVEVVGADLRGDGGVVGADGISLRKAIGA